MIAATLNLELGLRVKLVGALNTGDDQKGSFPDERAPNYSLTILGTRTATS